MRRQRWRLTADGPVAFTAVRLRTGALAYLTGHPVDELFDRAVEIGDVMGSVGRQLSSVVDGADDLATQAAGLERMAWAPKHFCLSAQVAEPLRAAGVGQISVAAEPTEAALLAILPPPS